MKKMIMKRRWRIFHARLVSPKLRFISWFDSRFPGKYCWADCVSWAYDPFQFNPFKAGGSKGCEIESVEHEYKSCYCGRWADGQCWDKLSKEEREKIIAELEKEKLPEGIPF